MYKTIAEMTLTKKRVLVRLDLNVPLKEGKVTDTTRIDASLKTIKHIISQKGKAILMSHLGRPGGEKKEEFSLAPVAKVLSEKLGITVTIAPDCVGKEVSSLVDSMKEGDVMLLENTRFYKEEQENNEEFSKKLSELCDVYVNDAFGTAHRINSSTYGVAAFVKEKCAGFLMDKELSIWKPIVEKKGSSVAIVGGAKLKEKIKAVRKFSKTFDRIILGGVVANVFMNAAGYPIGDSRCEEKGNNYCEEASDILAESAEKIVLPKEICVGTTEFEKKECMDPKKGLKKGYIAGDVLPTEEDISSIKNASVIIWFGPMGAYEFGFTQGSDMIASAINESSGYAVIGGGDVAAASSGVNAQISTGGGAAITYITTGKLDALEALKN